MDGIILAKQASLNAYAPYSNFKVGAALFVKDEVILASNVENASYGLCMCAERNAIFQAFNKGYRKQDIKQLYIYNASKTLIMPCGACLQVMVECMDEDCDIIVANDIEYKIFKLKQLLPYSFDRRNLDEL